MPLHLVQDRPGTDSQRRHDELAYAAVIAQAAAEGLRLHVTGAREQGMTWEQIGAAIGMSKQSAWESYGDRTLVPKSTGRRPRVTR